MKLYFYHSSGSHKTFPSKVCCSFPAHLNYIRSICGSTCVGLGGDFNGVMVVTEDLPDVASYPVLFAALIEDGTWSDEEMAGLANENMIKVEARGEVAQRLH